MPGLIKKNNLILGFVLINILTGVGAGILQMIVPLYAIDLKIPNAEIGFIKGFSSVGMLLLVIPAGFLVDYYGSKKLYLVGSILCMLVAFTVSFAQTTIALAILMCLYSLFRSLSYTAITSSFFKALKEFGTEKSGWIKGSLYLGFTFVGPLLGSALLKKLGFHWIFYVIISLMVIPILLVALYYKEGNRSKPVESFRENVNTQINSFTSLLRDKSIYLALFAEALSGACSISFSIFIIVLIVRVLHLEPTIAAMLITIEGGVFILAVFLAGSLVNRMAPLNFYLLSFGIVSIGLTGLSFSSNLPLIVLSIIVFGFGISLIHLITSSQIGEHEGDKGKLSSLYTAAGGIGCTIGPLAVGFASHYLGNQNSFFIFAPFFLLLSIWAIFREKQFNRIVHRKEIIQENAG